MASSQRFLTSQPRGLPSKFRSRTQQLLRPALLLAAAAWCSPLPTQPDPPACCSSCDATKSWPGFSELENVFSFGNSYTSSNFDPDGQQPTEDNPMGNPPYPGETSALPAPNWIGFLTTEYNQSSLLTYNIAVGGATVRMLPVRDGIPNLQEQVHNLFVPRYNHVNGTVTLARPWNGNDTLFAFWFGINDVNGSYERGFNATVPLNREIIQAYTQVLEYLYEHIGMRNVLILNVPAIDRSPLTRNRGPEKQALQREDLDDFNGLVLDMARGLKVNHDEANVWVYDSDEDFNKVMDDPTCFPQTSMLKNLTESCAAYGPVGTPENDTFIEECGVPVNQYLWLNDFHPTYPIHQVVASQIAKMLGKGPNIC
ncbi:unnamed protein product [Discula destructiva]